MIPTLTSRGASEAGRATGLEGEARTRRFGRIYAGPWICFVVTLLACLCQTGLLYGTRANLFWDAAHYIDSSRDLATMASHWLSGDVAGASMLLPRVGHKVLLDGPVLPVLGAVVYMALGKAPAYDNLFAFVVIQSLLQSLGALLACMLARKLTASNRWGLAGGLAWGLYPSAVIVAGIYMSETITTVMFLSLMVVSSVIGVSDRSSGPRASFVGAAVGFGFLAGLVLVTKPALIFAAAWIGLVTLYVLPGNRLRAVFVSSAVVGFLMVAMPWAAFTKCATGRIYLAPQRVPTHNIVMGFDIETDGFGTGPGSALDVLFGERHAPPAVAIALSKAHCWEVANLLVRKPERMWALPWNDLRRAFLGIPAVCLVWWHQVLVLAGILGAIATISQPELYVSTASDQRAGARCRASLIVGWSAVGVLLGHLIYVVFEAIPRYGFTAMPLFVLLSVFWLSEVVRFRISWLRLMLLTVPAGSWLVLNLNMMPYLIPVTGSAGSALWLETSVKMAMILAAAAVTAGGLRFPGERVVVRIVAVSVLALFGMVAVAAHALNPNAVREWECKLKDGQAACRQIWLQSGPYSRLPRGTPDWAAVLLDTDRNGVSARVCVNGRLLAGSPRSIYWYDPTVYSMLGECEQRANLLRKSPDSIRQWRVVHVPVSWLNLHGANLITVAPPAGGHASVFGDYPPAAGKNKILSSAFAAGKIWSSVNSLEGRVLSPIPAAPVQALSWMQRSQAKLTSDLSLSPGVQTGDYRIHLMLGYKNHDHGSPSESPSAGAQKSYLWELPDATFDPPLSATAMAAPVQTSPPRDLSWHRRLVAVEPTVRGRLYSLIRVRGETRTSQASTMASVALVLKGAAGSEPVLLPGALHNLSVSGSWKRFEIADEVPGWLPETGLSAVQIDVHAAPTVMFKNLELLIEPIGRPDLSRDQYLIL